MTAATWRDSQPAGIITRIGARRQRKNPAIKLELPRSNGHNLKCPARTLTPQAAHGLWFATDCLTRHSQGSSSYPFASLLGFVSAHGGLP